MTLCLFMETFPPAYFVSPSEQSVKMHLSILQYLLSEFSKRSLPILPSQFLLFPYPKINSVLTSFFLDMVVEQSGSWSTSNGFDTRVYAPVFIALPAVLHFMHAYLAQYVLRLVLALNSKSGAAPTVKKSSLYGTEQSVPVMREHSTIGHLVSSELTKKLFQPLPMALPAGASEKSRYYLGRVFGACYNVLEQSCAFTPIAM